MKYDSFIESEFKDCRFYKINDDMNKAMTSPSLIEEGDGILENSRTFNERVFDDDINESENDCIDDFMKGEIEVRNLDINSGYYQTKCYLTSDMKYRMESRRGVKCFPGKEGRAFQIAIPQCKIVNSTVLDNRACNEVLCIRGNNDTVRSYSFPLDFRNENSIHLPFYSGERDFSSYLKNRGNIVDTHIPFDVWCVIGAIYGKVIRNWKRSGRVDSSVPSWMYVRYSEIFETLNPQYSWRDISRSKRIEWTKFFNAVFDYVNNVEILHDLPGKEDDRYTRKAVRCGLIMKTTRVFRRAEGTSEEKSCLAAYGERWRPVGVKARIRGTWLFDFIWRHGGNPSVVYINKYDMMSRDVFGSRGGIGHCFHMAWAAWLVQYRNYWHRRGKDFVYCGKDGMLEFTKSEMDYALSGGFYENSRIDTSGMEKILERISKSWHLSHKNSGKWHLESYARIANGRIRWVCENPIIKSEESVVRDQNGETHSFSELVGNDGFLSIIPEEILATIEDQRRINLENENHSATVFGRKVNLHESVVFHAVSNNGKFSILENRFGRSYTSGSNGMQLLKRKYRLKMKIDGKSVSEVDFSALHPHMLYAMRGKQYKKLDLYDIGDWYSKYRLDKVTAREAVKKMFVIVINAANVNVAIHSFKRQWNEKNGNRKEQYIPWLYDLYDCLKREHYQISSDFCSGIGVKLQYVDGILIRKSIRRMTDEGICAAGIHDSIVVQKKYASKASKYMQEEYGKMFSGSTIPVKIK